MRRSTMAAIGGTTVGLAGVAAAVVARRARIREPGRIVQLRADELPYEPVIEGARMSRLRGDPQRGAHAVFTRFQPGFRVARHIHTHDITIVVISGAYVYGTDTGEERRVEAGGYLFMPGGTPHWSGGDPSDGALFFQECEHAFDLKILD